MFHLNESYLFFNNNKRKGQTSHVLANRRTTKKGLGRSFVQIKSISYSLLSLLKYREVNAQNNGSCCNIRLSVKHEFSLRNGAAVYLDLDVKD